MKNVDRLHGIAADVKRLQGEYRNLVGRSALIAKQMGELLSEARSLIQGRQWSKWLATELDLTPDAAFRYMTIYRKWGDIESHRAFPDLTIIQMFDVARGRKPRKRSYKLIGQSLDTLLDVLDERLSEAMISHPELEALIDAIDAARPILEKAGLLKQKTESRKQDVQTKKRAG